MLRKTMPHGPPRRHAFTKIYPHFQVITDSATSSGSNMIIRVASISFHLVLQTVNHLKSQNFAGQFHIEKKNEIPSFTG
jgi:hypothetical protein